MCVCGGGGGGGGGGTNFMMNSNSIMLYISIHMLSVVNKMCYSCIGMVDCYLEIGWRVYHTSVPRSRKCNFPSTWEKCPRNDKFFPK